MVAPTRSGDIIAGRYRVERVIGRGGMGVVVAARHLRLRERVAVKFLLGGRGLQGSPVARFVREGRAAMRLRSEHVVRVHDIDTLETGEPFLVMEYLEGRDLGAILADEGPLAPGAAVAYVLQAIEAIAEAHSRGIVHRDLKPSNLFLARRADGSPMIKVLDFGVAKNAGAFAETTITEPRGTIGTPAFMAPEQMRSDSVVDARSDVWALGATLFALVTGEPPFGKGTLLEIHERIQRGPPSLRGRAPEALDRILLRCLQVDPAARFADVAQLAEALADLAPEEARISAARAARILVAAPSAPDDATADEPDDPDRTASPDSPTAALQDASWADGGTEPPPPAEPVVTEAPPRPRASWHRALAVACIAATGVIAFAAVGNRHPAPTQGAPPAPAPVPEIQQKIGSAPVPVPIPEIQREEIGNGSGSGSGTGEPSSTTLAEIPAPARAPQRSSARAHVAAPSSPPIPRVRPRDPLADPD